MGTIEKNQEPKINISFLWHQHQPYYRNGDEFLLPWVRFHGTKDYFDMVRILDDYPKIRQNFNLVPSLLIQLEDYINDKVHDRIWNLSNKDPRELSNDEKVEILQNFFKCHPERMIKPYPRYLELFRLRGENFTNKIFPEINQKYAFQDWFDLQVWYNMVWIGEYSKYDPPYKKILDKGKNFNESDKQIVLRDTKEILKKIFTKHKEAFERDQIEVSFSPYYHPILPLLCDTNNGKISSPEIKMPSKRFKHPEDAEIQIKKSLDYYKKLFGKKPNGMWPSEGSLSIETLFLMSKNGIKWTATDEMVLYNSLKSWDDHQVIYRPYEYKTPYGNIKIVFRDHSLSDLIGFVYSGWGPDDAAKDMMHRVHNIRETILKNKGIETLNNSLVSIILDGENCWEYYQSDGKDFLRTLYWLMSNDEKINTTTISDFVLNKSPNANYPRTERIKSFPGSWINGNFKIWIGHEEDNKAWDLLSSAREIILREQRNSKHSKNTIEMAWEEIYIAEGSDWNWWYGDEHPTGDIDKFDLLFRNHLIKVYELLKLSVPEELKKSIKTTFPHIKIIQPEKFITPIIDGKRSSLTEWQKSGYFEPDSSSVSMHRVSSYIKQVFFGYDYDNVYLRINTIEDIHSDFHFVIHFLEPFEIHLDILSTGCNIKWSKDTRVNLFRYNFGMAFKDFLELFLSRKDFSFFENSFVSFEILVYENNKEIERLPQHDLIRFKLESESDLKNKKKHLLKPGNKI